ncbi:MAG: hypothetical protein ACREN8_12690, partial [Candidatus Dormibacteraceae bacterium]
MTDLIGRGKPSPYVRIIDRKGLYPAAVSLALLLMFATPAFAASNTLINFHAFNHQSDFASGSLSGGAQLSPLGGGSLTLQPGTLEGSWTSPDFHPGFQFSQVVTSWQANTPPGTWVETELSLHIGDHWSKWYVMGKWAFDTSTIQRTSVSGQADADGDVSTDTYLANAGHPADA